MKVRIHTAVLGVLALLGAGLVSSQSAQAEVLPGPTVTRGAVILTGTHGTVRTFNTTVTKSAVTALGYGKYEHKYATVWTGAYYKVPYGTDLQKIYTYTYKACLSDPYPLAQIWQECMTGRIYYAYSVLDGVGALVWGVNYSVKATNGTYYRGAHYCHTEGSYTFLSSISNSVCAEHRYDNLTSMIQWNTFDINQTGPLGSDTYSFHVNAYSSGYLSPVYLG